MWKATEVFPFLKKRETDCTHFMVRAWTCWICHVGAQQFDELRYQEHKSTGWQCRSYCKAARLQLVTSWSCYHFKNETLSICIRISHQLLLEYLPSFSSCSEWCLSNKPLQTHRWVTISHCACSWEHHCSKKCHCTQNKLLWFLKVRRLSVTYSGCTFLLYNIQMSAWPVTRLLSWSLGLLARG